MLAMLFSTGQPKQLPKKMIVLQMTGALLLGFLLISTLGLNHNLQVSVSDVCVEGAEYCGLSNGVDDLPFQEDEILISTEELSESITTKDPVEGMDPVIDVGPKQPVKPAQRPKKYPYTIVTAASANHLCSLENFLYALNELRQTVHAKAFPRIVVYNIGLNRTQLPILDQLHHNGLLDDLIMFDYSKYPRFWDVGVSAGEYAWKTGIVHEATALYGGVIVWLDSGNMVSANFLRHIPYVVRRKGFWSPRSSYSMGRWTHPGMFTYFSENPNDYADYPNCNGAAVGFDTTNQTIVDTLIRGWYQCGLDKQCIAPPGSSRLNHRQDQAVITYLAYRHGHSCTHSPERYYQLQTHRDKACRANLLEMQAQGKLHHPSSVDYPVWTKSDTLKLYSHPEWRLPEDAVPQHVRSTLDTS